MYATHVHEGVGRMVATVGTQKPTLLQTGTASTSLQRLRLRWVFLLLLGTLLEALAMGRAADRGAMEAKARGALQNRTRRQRRQRPEERLRVADPLVIMHCISWNRCSSSCG